MENELRTNKKECPKCGSENVQYLGTSGSNGRFIKNGGKLPPNEYHDFTCNDCGAEFKCFGDLQ
ncbi:hypothetical protein ES705_08878 [subsurface metagenome]